MFHRVRHVAVALLWFRRQWTSAQTCLLIVQRSVAADSRYAQYRVLEVTADVGQ